MRRQQVTLDGTVDASPIYLHGVRVNGGTHDVFFVTTTYGKTLAIDADAGTILWRFTPSGYDSWAGSRRITNSTPVADPNREFIYSATPDGRIQKLSVADGHSVWSTAITRLPRDNTRSTTPPRRPAVAATAATAIVLISATAFAANWPFNNRRHYFIAHDYVENLLGAIESTERG